MSNTFTPPAHIAPFANKSLVIFDWDGTLMDSIPLIVRAMHEAKTELMEQTGNIEVELSDEQIKSIIGLSLQKGIEQLFPTASDADIALITDAYAKYYIAHSSDSPLFAGVEAMIRSLHGAGKQLAIATGKKRVGLERVFEPSGIKGYFVASRCADESGSKPDPNMLTEILQETGVAVGEAVFVGDIVHDIAMANALGMDSIAVSYGAGRTADLQQQQPSLMVDSMEQLAQALGV